MKNHHIILFPFMAQGHINPFISLANRIEENSHHTITFVSTPLNIGKIRNSISEHSAIQFADLPFTSSNFGLPTNIENIEKLPFNLVIDFFHATVSLQPSFEELVLGIQHKNREASVCIIADIFLGWTVDSAKKLQVPHYVFVTSGAYGAAIFTSLCLNPPCPSTCSDEIALIDYPEVIIPRPQIEFIWDQGKPHPNPITKFLGHQISLSFKSRGMLINTSAEVENLGISLLQRSPSLPLWPIGPLLTKPSTQSPHSANCIEWLNNHAPTSVIYVSFGSQNSLPASQIMDLAKGLEASGLPFIWAIRPPLEHITSVHFRDEWLPEGFEKRMKESMKGVLVHGWAPQMEILSHRSIGAFMSHCGWNSVQESLSNGVPILGWPLLGDQTFNSRIMKELGVCVEVAVGFDTKNVVEGVKRGIELVMSGTQEGNEMKRKALEYKEIIASTLNNKGISKGQSSKILDDFLHNAFLKSHDI